MIVDYSAGIIRFTKTLPAEAKVFADYTPQAKRLTRGPEQDSNPFMFVEQTPMRNAVIPHGGAATMPRPIDRMWLFWRKPAGSGVQASAIYYKTYRMAVTLDEPISPLHLGDVTIDGSTGPCEVSWDGKRVYFTSVDERYAGMIKDAAGKDVPVAPVTITYHPAGNPNGTTSQVIESISWQEELHETALPTRLNINEGQVCAFADPCAAFTRVFVFWSSTRAGETDLYYETISPNFTGR
jgi:hypothetical protein